MIQSVVDQTKGAAVTAAELEETYDQVWNFRFGFAKVRIGSDYFHVRSDGLRAYEENFDWVGHFDKIGTAPVEKNGEQFRIRSDGTRVK